MVATGAAALISSAGPAAVITHFVYLLGEVDMSVITGPNFLLSPSRLSGLQPQNPHRVHHVATFGVVFTASIITQGTVFWT